MKIAIIGSGIAGMSCAYLLHPAHDITLFEKNDRLGGHSRTIDIPVAGKTIPVDTGFIVFNKRNYPLLTRLFHHLDVDIAESDMSFGVSIDSGDLEYGSKGMFAQKRNWFRPKFWGMLFDIMRFNKQAVRYIDHPADLTLQECLDELEMGDWFRRYYLQAMGAAIWSCSVETILNFPARSFLQFFKNHGLLTVNDHPQWYTVKDGSRNYIKKLTESYRDKIRLGTDIRSVTPQLDGVIIKYSNGQADRFDKVVFACAADQAKIMLQDQTEQQANFLNAFSYQKNDIVVHGDISFMPRKKAAWASWVYLSEQANDYQPVVSLSYWMNNLQPLQTDQPVIITLNPQRQPSPEQVYDQHVFSHPVFNMEALQGQNMLEAVQGQNGIFFCGAYQRYGFHEDGLLSAVNVARHLGIEPPWH